MTQSRLDLAFGADHPGNKVLMMGAGGADDLSPLDPARLVILQEHFPDHQALTLRGFQVVQEFNGVVDTVIVRLPRAKAAARHRLAVAVRHLTSEGALWVDGQKTDGIDAILKEMRGLGCQIFDVISKAHGKIFRVLIPESGLPADWIASPREVTPGFVTVPGVFSADGIDPGSQILADHLPAKLPTRLVDLGAGWGWLSAQALAKSGVSEMHLVEADYHALSAARQNITDPRARFHWADARELAWREPVNGVIMNPPFHLGRSADPRLGAQFIATAARILTTAGRLWMVANRHLPYESVLEQHFGQVREIGGDARFKVIEASAARKGRAAPHLANRKETRR